MQKACGIIAISAIALSVSQFASAQAPDQSSPPAGQSSALRVLREEVKNTLRDAGFTNIQIMSESFLVRAIDQNGDPVVIMVHPGTQTIRPEAPEDQDEANAAGAGDPDSLTDLSEDEEQAFAPEPRARIGKSSKLTDRPPMAEGEERAEDHQAPSQSANVRDGSPSQSAANEKIPGRPNGTMTEMKEAEQGALELTSAQRAEIWRRLGNQQATTAPPGFQPKVGATVPASMQLKTLPSSVSNQVPQVQSYDYAMVQSQLLIVDPATKKIVSIITE
jgi:hypothetical protein